jgi:hypothetical protein
MNERIRELAEQATSIQGPTPYNPLTFEVFDKEKFAELIVKECIHVAYNKMTIQKLDGIRPSAVCDAMKEHFGVES